MKGLLAMVVPTMAIRWVIVAAIMKGLFASFDYITCLVLAACLTPTDPIVSAVIIGGKYAQKHVPARIQRILSAESASNDGLAYPFLSISLYLTLEHNRAEDISDWVLIGWLYQVVLGILIGAVMGYLFSKVLRYTSSRGLADNEAYVAQYLALPIFTTGTVRTLGSDDLLAAFAAGSAISWDGTFNKETEGQVFAPVIEYTLNSACFVYIGAWLPWSDFNIPDLDLTPWRLVVLCIAIFVLRRFPAIMALYKWVPELEDWKEALFCGHFGPTGVSAIFVSTYALYRLPEPQNPPTSQQDILATVLHPVVGFVVLASVIVHGLSIPLFSIGKMIHRRFFASSGTLDSSSKTDTEDFFSVAHSSSSNRLPIYRPSTGDVVSHSVRSREELQHGVEKAEHTQRATYSRIDSSEDRTNILESTTKSGGDKTSSMSVRAAGMSNVDIDKVKAALTRTDTQLGPFVAKPDATGIMKQ
ncbi:putative Na(+)/H(+) antiporter C3A11.09 [Leucoagaricus sp. SymC.cos]|nr:putative Na(+)/H(+) antiporter C3A11.09 [Leucoagaricus sp. SymC.cos]